MTPTAGSPASSGCESADGDWEPVSPTSSLSASSRASAHSFGDSPAGAGEWTAADSPPRGDPHDDAPTRGRAGTPRVVAEPATATPSPGLRSQPVEVLAELADRWRNTEDYLGGSVPDDASPTSAADGSEYSADGARRSPAGTDGTSDTSDDGTNKSEGSYCGAYGTYVPTPPRRPNADAPPKRGKKPGNAPKGGVAAGKLAPIRLGVVSCLPPAIPEDLAGFARDLTTAAGSDMHSFSCPEYLLAEYRAIPEGSPRQLEFRANVKEAARTLGWLRNTQWEGSLLAALREGMRIRDDAAAAKALTMRWVVLGSSYVAAARNAVVAYEKWYETIVPETADSCPYPIDETLATYFLVSATAAARSNHQARAQAALERGGASPEWRGTTAKMRRAGLKAAVESFGLHMDRAVLDARSVVMAVAPPLDAAMSAPRRAFMPLDVAERIEWMASGPAEVPAVARELARYLSIAMTNSLRAAELAGLSVVSVESNRGGGPDVGRLHCAGSKGKHARLHHPFSIATSSDMVMVRGRRAWLAGFLRDRAEWSALVPRVRRTEMSNLRLRNHGVWVDSPMWDRTFHPASASDVCTMLDLVLEYLQFTRAVRTDCCITGHGPRHLLADVARVMRLRIELINELGRWSESQLAALFVAMGQEATLRGAGLLEEADGIFADTANAKGLPKIFRGCSAERSMGARYSSGEAAAAREQTLREDIYERLRAWIGDGDPAAVFARTRTGAMSPFTVLARARPGASVRLAATDKGRAAAEPAEHAGPRTAATADAERDDGEPDEPEPHPRWGTVCMVCHKADATKRTMLLCQQCERGCHVDCHDGIVETPHRTQGVPDYTHRSEWLCPRCAPGDYVPLSQM